MTEADALERLQAMRAELDGIDAELIGLLGRRFRTIRAVAEHKRQTGLAVMQPSRVQEVLATRLRRAGEAGLDPKLVERLWTTIITHACQIENAVGGIEGGELMFQGVSLDHARVEVDDLDAACAAICRRLSFERLGQDEGSDDPDAAILKGGDITLLVSERAPGQEGDVRPAHVAIQVHKLASTVNELRRRGNSVEVNPESGSGVRMATVSLGAPAHLCVHYVERAPGARPVVADLDARAEPIGEEARREA
ncbi:MAG: chorismate mutase [Amaricoccus sp.]